MIRIKGLTAKLYNRLNRHKILNKSEYWDAKANFYHGLAVSLWPNCYFDELFDHEQKAVLSDYMDRIKGKNILDIGCGTGRLSEFFAESGFRVRGIDFSERSIVIARQNSRQDNPDYIVKSAWDIKDSNFYDAVISCGCLSSTCKDADELKKLLKIIYEALKPGGVLLISEPVHKGFLRRALNMNAKEFKKALEESRFQVVSSKNLSFWPAMLVLANIHWPKNITVWVLWNR